MPFVRADRVHGRHAGRKSRRLSPTGSEQQDRAYRRVRMPTGEIGIRRSGRTTKLSDPAMQIFTAALTRTPRRRSICA